MHTISDGKRELASEFVAGAPSAPARYSGLSCDPINNMLFRFQRGGEQLRRLFTEDLFPAGACFVLSFRHRVHFPLSIHRS